MSEAIQKVMLDYVIPNLDQAEIEELIAELAKFSSSAATPKPREWRLWDMVMDMCGAIWLRTCTSGLCWEKITDVVCHSKPDDYINATFSVYLGNLADLLAQGDVLVALMEEETEHIRDLWNNCSGCVSIRDKAINALAARKETL